MGGCEVNCVVNVVSLKCKLSLANLAGRMQQFLASFSNCSCEMNLWNCSNLASIYFNKPVKVIRFSKFYASQSFLVTKRSS